MHIFQQKGYKFNEYWHWLLENWSRRVVTLKHVILLFIIAVLLWVFSGLLTSSASIIILTIFGIFWFTPVGFYSGRRQKKPLVFTPRMIRLCIPLFIICLIIPGLGTWWALTHARASIVGIAPLISIDMYLLSFAWLIGSSFVPYYIL